MFISQPFKQANPSEAISSNVAYLKKLMSKGINNLDRYAFKEFKRNCIELYKTDSIVMVELEDIELYRISINKSIVKSNTRSLSKLSEIMGPPDKLVKIGRCNLIGRSVFYAAQDIETAFRELSPEKNDLVSISKWRVKKKEKFSVIVNNMANNNDVKLANKKNEQFQKELPLHPVYKNAFNMLNDFLAHCFSSVVSKEETRKYYPTALYCDKLLNDKNRLCVGVIYASVKRDTAVNFALRNMDVLSILEPVEVQESVVIKVDKDLDGITQGVLLGDMKKTNQFDKYNDAIIWG